LKNPSEKLSANFGLNEANFFCFKKVKPDSEETVTLINAIKAFQITFKSRLGIDGWTS